MGRGRLQSQAVSCWVIKALWRISIKSLETSVAVLCASGTCFFSPPFYTSAFLFTILFRLSSEIHITQTKSKTFASLVWRFQHQHSRNTSRTQWKKSLKWFTCDKKSFFQNDNTDFSSVLYYATCPPSPCFFFFFFFPEGNRFGSENSVPIRVE